MEFGILGPVQVRVAGQDATPAGTRLRLLLAMLLLQAGLTVPADTLVQALWEDDASQARLAALPTYVMRLRRAVGVQVAARIVTQPGGYAITVAPDELDLHRFQKHWDEGRAQAARGDLAGARTSLSAAVRLWRGEPLATLPAGRVVANEVEKLAGRRVAAYRDLFEVSLKLGRAAELLPDIAALAAAYPFDEELRGYWMLALYRGGRTAEALRVFAQTRAMLADELGVEPGKALQDLHQRMLTGDTEPRREPAVPRQLPAGLRGFVGRARELAELEKLAGDDAGVIAISAIGGTAGVGKTTLAVHFAYQVADRFPDGQLFADLRGFDPSGVPADAATVASGFLLAMGVPAEQIPADLDARLALYRTRLAGTRTLVVLDNARDAEQVRPLLPGGAGCLVVVTSRARMPGLIAREGAAPLPLDVLDEHDGLRLLAQRLGDRVAAEPAAAAALVRQCAGLPLAIGVVAAHAALRPGRTLAAILQELRTHGLDQLADVRTVLSWSYRALPDRAAHLFRLLALHPVNDISEYAAAALTGTSVVLARGALAELADAHLVTEYAPGRYTQHDLLRAYAAELMAADPAAISRLVDHYLAHAGRAAKLSYGSDNSFRPVALPAPPGGAEPVDDRPSAMEWYAREHVAAIATIALAPPDRAWSLAAMLVGYLHRAGRWEQWEAVSEAALAAALRTGDLSGQAHALRWLGEVRRSQDDQDAALLRLEQALALFERTGDHKLQGETLADIAMTHGERHAYADAVAVSRRALELFAGHDDAMGQARALNQIGWYLAQDGDYAAAVGYCRRALDLARAFGDPRAEAATLDSIGFGYHHLGAYREAIAYFEESGGIRRALGDYFLEAETLTHVGDSRLALGEPAAARRAWQQSLDILTELGHRDAAGVRARLAALRPDE
ncbi:AfsR/SARP family transcriptional regulator [Hamadaea tsunoensis]|uniref:AfsR/SARP family transcriptional regulator n=1 Tax=Hamadaea tsunoensis TaxID=53368 RepID=UPI000407CD8B|nr:BTAD domain-containing putative transcriptional regulator [Hamadaea tsunoensis]